MQKNQVVAIYTRTGGNGNRSSLDDQLTQCITGAQKEYGADVQWQVFADEGISGKSQGTRSGLNTMMKAVGAGEVQAVLTWNVNRLGRNLTDALLLVREIDERGVTFISMR